MLLLELTEPLVSLGDGVVQKPSPQIWIGIGFDVRACVAAEHEAVEAELAKPLPERRGRLHLDREHFLPLAPVDRQDLVGLEPGRAKSNGIQGEVLWDKTHSV